MTAELNIEMEAMLQQLSDILLILKILKLEEHKKDNIWKVCGALLDGELFDELPEDILHE